VPRTRFGRWMKKYHLRQNFKNERRRSSPALDNDPRPVSLTRHGRAAYALFVMLSLSKHGPRSWRMRVAPWWPMLRQAQHDKGAALS
jgi:hypothetical protein